MSKPTPSAPIQIRLFVYIKDQALPVLARVVAALFGNDGVWRGRAVAKKSEQRVSRLRSPKAVLDRLSAAFEGSLNAIYLHGDLAGVPTHPMVETVDITVRLSPLAADWALIDPKDPEFSGLKRNLVGELLSLMSTQGYVSCRNMPRHPCYLQIELWPAASTSLSTEGLRSLALPLAKQLALEQAGGFVGYVDTLETAGYPDGCAANPNTSTRMDTYFDAAHRVTIGTSATLRRYAKDIADAYPGVPQNLEVYGTAAVHSFETWQSVWKVYLPAWHDAKVQ